MNRQEMMQYHDDPPTGRKPKMRVQFGKTETWRDYHGTHRHVDIWYGGEVAGSIRGDTWVGSSSRYDIKIGDKSVGGTYDSMAAAKAYVRTHFGKMAD